MAYIGAEPIVSATRTITEVTATAGQTVFTANGGYTVGYIDVFLNGAQLQTVDFTATNGTTITLTEAAQVGDVIRLVAWGTFLASTALTNTNPSYTGTLTGGTGVVNIGSGQVYKDASGNVGIGTNSPAAKLQLSGGAAQNQFFVNTSTSVGSKLGGSYFYSSNTNDGWYSGIDAFVTAGSPGIDRTDLRFYTTSVTAQERMRLTSAGLLQFNSGYGSVATAYGCRAWVNFNGQGTVAIRASGNVSSITDNGAGNYTVNFTTAMPDASYAANGSTWRRSTWTNGGIGVYSYQTTSISVENVEGGAGFDTDYFSVSVFR